MSRLQLFAFFATMAVASLIFPRRCKDMIDCAQEGDRMRRKRKAVAALRGFDICEWGEDCQ